MGKRKQITARAIVRSLLSTIYLAAGLLHLAVPGPFLSITPSWVPFPEQVVALTGLAELAGAFGLLVPRFRRAAGIGLALYALCVFPANIQHALDSLGRPEALSGLWHHVPRLLLQPVIVWWALWASAVIDWPFARNAGTKSV